MERDTKKLYATCNSAPFRTPWTKHERCNLTDVGGDTS